MSDIVTTLLPSSEGHFASSARFPLITAIALTVALFACSVYANLSFAVTDPSHYRYFPPFQAGYNGNMNRHLGAEYLHIAQAMVAGQGFANPFKEQTGPTAWMPPILPTILATLLWASDGDLDTVMAVMIYLQVFVLAGTGLLVMVLALQTTNHLGAVAAAILYFASVIASFHYWYQFTHDCWLVLLALDLLIAGLCWGRPLRTKLSAGAWGVAGGLLALVNPIVGFTWGIMTLILAFRQRSWSRLIITGVCTFIALTPWALRNYLLFGRLIPIKSNAAYELYQSQCLIPDGLLMPKAFGRHPYVSAGPERQQYKKLGEVKFLDLKREQFWKAVAADPEDFLDRVAWRFLGATVWYVPFDRSHETRRPWTTWLTRVIHPLPFLAMILLIFCALLDRLPWGHGVVIGVYSLYLLPYIAISYYDRYAMPLLVAKVLLVVWGLDRLLAMWHSWNDSSTRGTAAPLLSESQDVPGLPAGKVHS